MIPYLNDTPFCPLHSCKQSETSTSEKMDKNSAIFTFTPLIMSFLRYVITSKYTPYLLRSYKKVRNFQLFFQLQWSKRQLLTLIPLIKGLSFSENMKSYSNNAYSITLHHHTKTQKLFMTVFLRKWPISLFLTLNK